jgi:hypothetical protein
VQGHVGQDSCMIPQVSGQGQMDALIRMMREGNS